jgi:RNA polymerase sigma-70 factor, ECF subfamily
VSAIPLPISATMTTTTTTKSPAAELADEELARRAKAGSAAHFEELVRRFQVPLLRFLSRRVRVDAEDLVQETFARAYERLHQFTDGYRFGTWLFTIAQRLAIDHGRRSKPVGEMVVESECASEAAGSRLEREETKSGLWDLAKRLLTEEQFAALWLHYVEEMPAGEVARVLGRSWVSVKTMLHRARKRMLPHLRDERDGEV